MAVPPQAIQALLASQGGGQSDGGLQGLLGGGLGGGGIPGLGSGLQALSDAGIVPGFGLTRGGDRPAQSDASQELLNQALSKQGDTLDIDSSVSTIKPLDEDEISELKSFLQPVREGFQSFEGSGNRAIESGLQGLGAAPGERQGLGRLEGSGGRAVNSLLGGSGDIF